MDLIRSFYSPVVVRHDLKKYGLLSLLYTFVLAFMMPTLVLSNIYYNLRHVGMNPPEVQMVSVTTSEGLVDLMGFVVPVLMAILLFRYIQKNKSLSKIHSLPITRMQLFNSHYMAGMVLITVPVLINMAAMLVGVNALRASDALPHSETVLYFLSLMIVQWAMFSLAVAVNMSLGYSLVGGLFTFLFSFVQVYLAVVVDFMMNIHLKGHVLSGLHDALFFQSPYLELDGYVYMSWSLRIILIGYCVIGYFAGRWLYKKRNLERCSEVFSFNGARYFWVVLITFFVGFWLTGVFGWSSIVYRMNIQDEWVYQGLLYLVLAIISIGVYFIGMMIVTRRLRVWKYYKGLVVYFVLVACFILGLRFDLVGYEDHIPEVDEVKFVSLRDIGNDGLLQAYRDVYETDELIGMVREFHKMIIEEDGQEYSGEYSYIEIIYVLDNGKLVKRDYSIQGNLYREVLGDLYEADSLHEQELIMDLDYKEINGIVVRDSDIDIEKKDYEKVVEAIKEGVASGKVSRNEIGDNGGGSEDSQVDNSQGVVVYMYVADKDMKVHTKYRSYGTIGWFTEGFYTPYADCLELRVDEELVESFAM